MPLRVAGAAPAVVIGRRNGASVSHAPVPTSRSTASHNRRRANSALRGAAVVVYEQMAVTPAARFGQSFRLDQKKFLVPQP